MADTVFEVLVHFGVGLPLALVGLEDRVPPEVSWACRRDFHGGKTCAK